MNSSSTSPDSAYMTFAVGATPVAPTTISPTGTIASTTPAYVWNAVSGASGYNLYVYSIGSSTYVIKEYTLKTSLYCSGGTCTHTSSTALTSGNYEFKVAARNSCSTSASSAWKTFTISP